MDAFVNYLLQNWALILILLAFLIMLKITVFIDRKTAIRMLLLVISIFALSIIVFTEFYLADLGGYREARLSMMAIRYSATPLIIALILFASLGKWRWYAIIPAAIFAILNIVSTFTGIVFDIDNSGNLVRGVLGFLPYIAVGIYSVALIVTLIWKSDKLITDIIPISFTAFVLASGVIFPLVIGKEYSKIFCTTIAIALFVYYVFLILQLTKKDSLTGLLNRQAYYVSIKNNAKEITAFISIDMNELKTINDNYGHSAGDEALITLSKCFTDAVKRKQLVYRVGGDEFAIICLKTSEEELNQLLTDIKENVAKTNYTCSIGYCYSPNESKNMNEMIKESDEMMYEDKARYYKKSGSNRRTK
ncbi:MAG: diguanylate cyclase [Bacilli bacterium]|nr:diguanylate cyclase [Bacilli bacterium]